MIVALYPCQIDDATSVFSFSAAGKIERSKQNYNYKSNKQNSFLLLHNRHKKEKTVIVQPMKHPRVVGTRSVT